MTEEFIKFMKQNTIESMAKLKNYIGEKVTVLFNKTVEEHMPPVQAKIVGVLQEVENFKNVVISGTKIYFVSKHHIISEILDKNLKPLYDKTLVVNKLTKVKNNLSKYTEAILGIPYTNTKAINLSSTKERTA
jgi:small nuclear ribonucleoprotein (snRNP)-like protein